MRRLFIGLWLMGFAALGSSVWFAAAAEPKEKTALEADAQGWVDLLPNANLDHWKRVPCPPDEKLSAKNPWKVDGKVLFCNGVGIKEMLLHDKMRTDGIFHLEWRFHKVDKKADYNSGAYVRTAPDGKLFFQVQIAEQDKAPRYADVFTDLPVDGKPKRVVIEGTGPKLVKGVGEWNTYEIACKGKTLTVRVNGAVATTWNDCPVPEGLVGMQAEFFDIDFRNIKFKESK